MKNGVQEDKLTISLHTQPPSTVQELMASIKMFMIAEQFMQMRSREMKRIENQLR